MPTRAADHDRRAMPHPDDWHQYLREQLDLASQQQLHRRLVPTNRSSRVIMCQGRELLNFSGNDYLALSQHPKLIEAAIDAANRYGTGSGASRLVVGHLDLHREIEQRLASFKHAEAALLLPTGYMANLAVLTALAGPGDLVLMDKLTHASLIDAVRLSGAKLRTFRHLEYSRLESLLQSPTPNVDGRRFVVTDSVFSMDGDVADLPRIVAMARAHNAITIVDEAHGTGVLGQTGSGLIEAQGIAGQVDVVISTASKALGGLGGIVTGPTVVIDTLVQRARAMIYTTAATPIQTVVLDAALNVVKQEPDRRAKLTQLWQQLRNGLSTLGWLVGDVAEPTPIVPVPVGEAGDALALAARLQDAGIAAVAIRPPTVRPGTSRIRLSLRCDHTAEDIDRLLAAIGPPVAS